VDLERRRLRNAIGMFEQDLLDRLATDIGEMRKTIGVLSQEVVLPKRLDDLCPVGAPCGTLRRNAWVLPRVKLA
jgi:hypothetical protein